MFAFDHQSRLAGVCRVTLLLGSGFIKAPAPAFFKPAILSPRHRRRAIDPAHKYDHRAPSISQALSRNGWAANTLFTSQIDRALRSIAIAASIAAFIAFPAPTLSEQPDAGGRQQTPLKTMTLDELGNIEVTTVSKAPQRALDTTAAIYVITQEDIQRSGATTIPDALRLAPGVDVAQIDTHSWSVGIRGFGNNLSRNVLVLIDGRSVYTTLFAGTWWDGQNLFLADVDRIEIIRGPGGTIWGPNAVNGVINIITKSTKDTHGATVSAGGGDILQGFLNAHYGGGNSKGLDYRVYELGFDRGPQYHSDGIKFDRWRAIQGGFRTDWAKDTRDHFTFQGDIFDESAGTGDTVSNYTMPYLQTLYGTEQISGGNILGRWQRVYQEGKDIQLQASYEHTNRYDPTQFKDIHNTFDIDFLDRFRLPARQQISWGLGARFSHADNPIVVPGEFFSPESRTDRLTTAFFQDEIRLIDKQLTFTFGTKILETNFTGWQLQPTGRLSWTPTNSQTFWTAFTHAVRTPSDIEENFTELVYAGTASGLPVFGEFNPNPKFHSEELNGYEAGYRLLAGKSLYFDVAAFYNHYGDLLSEDIIGPPAVATNPAPTHIIFPAGFGNGLVGTTKGIEFAPEWRPLATWRLRGSYSYLQMDIKKGTDSLDAGTASTVNGSSPKHRLSLQSDLDFAKVFSLDLTYRYVAVLPDVAGGSIPAYSTGDARFDWRFAREFKLSAVGRNLAQPRHVEFGGPDPGPNVGIRRGFYGEITFTK